MIATACYVIAVWCVMSVVVGLVVGRLLAEGPE